MNMTALYNEASIHDFAEGIININKNINKTYNYHYYYYFNKIIIVILNWYINLFLAPEKDLQKCEKYDLKVKDNYELKSSTWRFPDGTTSTEKTLNILGLG